MRKILFLFMLLISMVTIVACDSNEEGSISSHLNNNNIEDENMQDEVATNVVIDEDIILKTKTTVDEISSEFEENGYTVTCEEVEQQILTGKRYVLTLSGGSDGGITLYEYEDFEQAQADAQCIDESGNEVNFDSETKYITWKSMPHFYQYNNLIVQYVGTDITILKLLTNLCGEQFAGGVITY